MTLTLRVISHHGAALGEQAEHCFDARGGTIGRAAGSDWQLPDPDRVLSSRHAIVQLRAGTWYVEDTSTNGVYLNAASQPIGRGNSAPLRHRDRLMIGDYEIAVSIEADSRPDAPSASWLDSPAPAGELLNTSPTHPTELTADEDALDPLELLDDSAAGSTWDLRHTGAMPDHLAADQQHFEPPRASNDQIPEEWALTGFNAPARPAPVRAPAAAPAWESPPDQESGGFAATSPAGLLPEDWDKSIFSPSSPAAGPQHARIAPRAPAPAPAPAPVERTTPGDAQRVRPQARAAEPAPLPPPEPPRSVPRASRAVPETTAPVTPVAPAAHEAAPVAAPGRGDLASLSALLEGAGLPPSSVAPGGALELMQTAGSVFREVVSGLLDVLAARAEFKNQFRIARTMVRPAQNNPLKFSPSVDDAMTTLLSRRGGFMGPVEAVHEGFDDLKAHQMAVVAGMRAAFMSVLERFDPAQLEAAFERDLKGGGLLAKPRKLRYWDLYREHYAEHAADADEAFRELFGDEFVRAYEEQMAAFEQGRERPSRR